MASTNITFTHLKDWMDQTLRWLHADGSTTILQKPHTQLLEMMSRSKKENHANAVWDLIDKLERLANRASDTQEKGEIFINCAKMAADLENLKSALYFFQAADTHYLGFQHQRAIVLWMTGCIHWVLRDNVEGISAWQRAISLFQQRQSNTHLDTDEGKWYAERLVKLEAALADAINTGELPHCNLSTVPESTQPIAPETVSEQSFFFEGDSIRWVSCQVSESVPAGGFGPTGFDPNSLGFLEISEVLIEDEPYQVFCVQRPSSRHNIVDISHQYRYQTVCVKGTSMNAAKPIPIVEGDFVLIQAQPDVGDNEIVVAGITGQDERATVKRLKRRNGKIRLVPETTDPKHSEIDWEKEFSELDEDFRIIGTVIAIFKKKP
jgi:peptidase S24-like protein